MSKAVRIEEGKHSTVGASSAYRWLACPGSVGLAAKLVEQGHNINRTSRAAAEGTAAHTVLSDCLDSGRDAHEMAGNVLAVSDFEFVVDDEMVEAVQECLDFVREKVTRYESEGHTVHLYVEKGLSSVWDEEVYGTADVIIHVVGERLVVIDFKYGKGVTVEPTSIQNGYYGYLAVENYLGSDESVKVVESWIAQPRIPHAGGTLRRHITSEAALSDWWFSVILPGIQATREEDASFSIGEQCRFCPAKNNCPALKGEAFDVKTDIDPSHLTGDELGQLLVKVDAVKRYLEGLQSEAYTRCLRGDDVAGFKIVKKMSKRVWKPDAEMELEAFELFGKDAYKKPDMLTPPQLEKAVDGGKEFVKKWAYKPENGLTLAPNSDKRSAVVSLMDEFISGSDASD
jgi:hypothetical protein